MRLCLLSSLFLFLGGWVVLCEEHRINSADELIKFSNDVNGGTNFKGTTVLLNSDIDLSGKTFEPIGKGQTNYFSGTFDGQGYTISNLVIDSSLQYVGIFGYSEGATIKNVVMDSSCSITSSSSSSLSLGGIIGSYYSDNSLCVTENVVNMASVIFNGNASGLSLHFGGIVGCLSSSTYEVIVKNCANYGSVSNKGTSKYSYIGGIVGYSHESASELISIQNCFNYGTITNNNTKSSFQYTGGIIGFADYTHVENCVNSGKVTSSYSSGYIGGIAGYVSFFSQVSNCYWDKDGSQSAYGSMNSGSISECYGFDSTTFELSESVSVGDYTGTSLLNALNAWTDHYCLRDYSHWALNKNSNTITFTINGRANPLTLNSKIILLPSLASEGLLWFDWWYTDASCETPLASFEITSSKELYGKWGENTNSYIITFDTRGGTSIEPITAQFGSVISLPSNTERDNCTVALWENDCGDVVSWDFTVPAHNLTLHAVWSCTRLNSATDLVDFSKVVNSGSIDYNGTTVFLDSDIVFTEELSKKFIPIGKDDNFHFNYFIGTFDGQGHTISNFEISNAAINLPSYFVGLFGYSRGMTIRNVVVDSSCSITSYYRDSSSVGSIIGSCNINKNSCIIENIVNMGDISFINRYSLDDYDLYVGGIIGYSNFNSYSYSGNDLVVKNCVNYGSITHSTENFGVIYFGGIIGESSSYFMNSYVQNCLNYGSISFYGNSSKRVLTIGGITGGSDRMAIENCASAGKINSRASSMERIGSIMGVVNFNASITHCLWTSDLGYDNVTNGKGSSEVTSSYVIPSLNTTTIEEMNEYAKKGSTWSRWAMLHLNGGSISSLGKKGQIGGLLKTLPIPVKKGESFLFWCIDEECNKKFVSGITEANGVTDLYSLWTDSSLTITFDFRNGTVINVSFRFNDTIKYPDGMMREGFTFSGWSPNPERMPAENIFINAQWNITKPSEYVEIVFAKKNMTREEAKAIIKKYIPEGEECTIVKFENGEDGTIVIIKFEEKSEANKFINAINENITFSRLGIIKIIRPAGDYESLAFAIHPALFLFWVFLQNILSI